MWVGRATGGQDGGVASRITDSSLGRELQRGTRKKKDLGVGTKAPRRVMTTRVRDWGEKFGATYWYSIFGEWEGYRKNQKTRTVLRNLPGFFGERQWHPQRRRNNNEGRERE